jgi:hypothetical protein
LFLFGERAPEYRGYFNSDALNSEKISFISDLVIYNFFQDYLIRFEENQRNPHLDFEQLFSQRKLNPNHLKFVEQLFLEINRFAVQDETILQKILSGIEAIEESSKDYLLAPYWTEYIIAFRLVQQYEPIETFYEHGALIQEASRLLREKILENNMRFPISLIETIGSIVKSDDKPLYHTDENNGNWFLCKLFVSFNDNEKENEAIYNRLNSASDAQYEFQRIRYIKTHGTFELDDFLKNIPLDLIEWAVRAGDVDELTFLKKLPLIVNHQFNGIFTDNFQGNFASRYNQFSLAKEKNREAYEFYIHDVFVNRYALVNHIIFKKPFFPNLSSEENQIIDQYQDCWKKIFLSQEPEFVEKRAAFFDALYKRVEEELDTEYIELFTFLILYEFRDTTETLSTEQAKFITRRCTKILGLLRTMKWEQWSDIEERMRYNAVLPFIGFLFTRYPLWKGIKPLLQVLRASKKVLVKHDLSIKSDLMRLIEGSFYRKTKLKQLRQDMADGLADLLKPLPEKKRSSERLDKYSEEEQKRKGFDIIYQEPDPIWRYAYVRAIADLGVDTDGKGHYLHSILDEVAQHDPETNVRKAAQKASIKLQKLRDGWDKDNHTKHLCHAFWWIRQAHLLSLGVEINKREALKIRTNEHIKE